MGGWTYYCSVEDPIVMHVQLLLVDAMQINGEECSITVVQRVPLQVKRFRGVRRCDDAHLSHLVHWCNYSEKVGRGCSWISPESPPSPSLTQESRPTHSRRQGDVI